MAAAHPNPIHPRTIQPTPAKASAPAGDDPTPTPLDRGTALAVQASLRQRGRRMVKSARPR